MKSIRYLGRLGRTCFGGFRVSAGAIAADHFHLGMLLQPSSEGLGRTVRQEFDHPVRFQIDQQCPISLASSPGPIIHSEYPHWCS